MALVACGDCGKEISDRAPTCPNCGAPNASAPVASGVAPATRKVEIEATNRGLKTQMILAFLLTFTGCMGAFTEGASGSGTGSPWWGFMMLAGALWWLVARIRAWYGNG